MQKGGGKTAMEPNSTDCLYNLTTLSSRFHVCKIDAAKKSHLQGDQMSSSLPFSMNIPLNKWLAPI